jgi:hypothetical protein
LISWSSKISRSSAKDKFDGLANVAFECIWLCNLPHEVHINIMSSARLQSLHFSFPLKAVVYCDNLSTVYVSLNPVHHPRIIKHVWTLAFILSEKLLQPASSNLKVIHAPTHLPVFHPDDQGVANCRV